MWLGHAFRLLRKINHIEYTPGIYYYFYYLLMIGSSQYPFHLIKAVVEFLRVAVHLIIRSSLAFSTNCKLGVDPNSTSAALWGREVVLGCIWRGRIIMIRG